MSRYDGTSPGHLSQEILPDSFLACFDCAKAKAKCEKKVKKDKKGVKETLRANE